LDKEDSRAKLLKILKNNKRRLVISRVPIETKKQFIEHANKYYEGDYGMLLMTAFNDYLLVRKLKELIIGSKAKIEVDKNGDVLLLKLR